MTVCRLLLTGLLAAAMPLTAAACGVCIEDKVAATYDHAVVTRAARDKHTVAFFEISGLASRVPPNRQLLADFLEKTHGVERGTVRISLEEAAVSFAVNAGKYPLNDVMKRIDLKLSTQHMRLKLIRTLYNGNLSKPS